jgi:hypothetical protein
MHIQNEGLLTMLNKIWTVKKVLVLCIKISCGILNPFWWTNEFFRYSKREIQYLGP